MGAYLQIMRGEAVDGTVPTFAELIDAAKAAAPYFAPKLAWRTTYPPRWPTSCGTWTGGAAGSRACRRSDGLRAAAGALLAYASDRGRSSSISPCSIA